MTRLILREIARFVLPMLISVALIFVLWEIFLWSQPDIGRLIGKSPSDVWNYLFSGNRSGKIRSDLFANVRVTLKDSAIGFVAGMAAATATAIGFVLSRSLQATMMPLVMLLRSVPLMAMAPVIILVFGRETMAVAVIAGIVVYFPALVMIAEGLRTASTQSRDLVVAYGGGNREIMRLVMLPSAVPALFSAAKVSAPGAIVGAMLAEFLGTGQGLGSSLVRAATSSKGNELWASMVIITLISVLIYTIIGIFERIALATYGPNAGRSS